MAAADAKTTQLDWQPVFFDAHQNETMIALAEQIVPKFDPGASELWTTTWLA